MSPPFLSAGSWYSRKAEGIFSAHKLERFTKLRKLLALLTIAALVLPPPLPAASEETLRGVQQQENEVGLEELVSALQGPPVSISAPQGRGNFWLRPVPLAGALGGLEETSTVVAEAPKGISIRPLKRSADTLEQGWYIQAHEGAGGYHNLGHSTNVANFIYIVSLMGDFFSPEQAELLYIAGLLHDLDPILQGIQGKRQPGTAAAVPRTIKLLRKDFYEGKGLDGGKRSYLREVLKLDELKFLILLAVIARSEYPWTDMVAAEGVQGAHPNPYYKGSSPYEKYREILLDLVKYLQSEGKSREEIQEDLIFAMRAGAIFSEYADKSSYYALANSFAENLKVARALADEINESFKLLNEPQDMDLQKLAPDKFLSGIGVGDDKGPWDRLDRQLADELGKEFGFGAEDLHLPNRKELFERLPVEYGAHFEAARISMAMDMQALREELPERVAQYAAESAFAEAFQGYMASHPAPSLVSGLEETPEAAYDDPLVREAHLLKVIGQVTLEYNWALIGVPYGVLSPEDPEMLMLGSLVNASYGLYLRSRDAGITSVTPMKWAVFNEELVGLLVGKFQGGKDIGSEELFELFREAAARKFALNPEDAQEMDKILLGITFPTLSVPERFSKGRKAPLAPVRLSFEGRWLGQAREQISQEDLGEILLGVRMAMKLLSEVPWDELSSVDREAVMEILPLAGLQIEEFTGQPKLAIQLRDVYFQFASGKRKDQMPLTLATEMERIERGAGIFDRLQAEVAVRWEVAKLAEVLVTDFKNGPPLLMNTSVLESDSPLGRALFELMNRLKSEVAALDPVFFIIGPGAGRYEENPAVWATAEEAKGAARELVAFGVGKVLYLASKDNEIEDLKVFLGRHPTVSIVPHVPDLNDPRALSKILRGFLEQTAPPEALLRAGVNVDRLAEDLKRLVQA